ncbi:hypothetical protein ACGFNU_06160 [Spirillospora sp. NPDC048911]|uniref:hypothetical protein n=1 Tax=Spirillospora sp. NPDC048911 TaxID=3364527 RepID=UPI00371642CD
MIKTILRTGAVTATIAGATFLAAPAYADPHNDGHGNTTYVVQFGEYIANCGGLPSESQGVTHCDSSVENVDGGGSEGGPEGSQGPGGMFGLGNWPGGW